jgi:hypothetical protein
MSLKGPDYLYSQKQLQPKGLRHLSDFGISPKGKTLNEIASTYMFCVEELLRKPDLIWHKDGIMNKQEPAILGGDPESGLIAAFEK